MSPKLVKVVIVKLLTVSNEFALLNVKLGSAAKSPLLLNCTCVFDPAAEVTKFAPLANLKVFADITLADTLPVVVTLDTKLPFSSMTRTDGIPTPRPPTKPKGSNAIFSPKNYYYIYLCSKQKRTIPRIFVLFRNSRHRYHFTTANFKNSSTLKYI